MHKPWLLRPFNLAAGTDFVGRISVTQTDAPEWPHMHQSWQQHVYEQYLFLFVCVCDAEKELGPLLMQTAISTAAAA